jgi:hypothetical protein
MELDNEGWDGSFSIGIWVIFLLATDETRIFTDNYKKSVFICV